MPNGSGVELAECSLIKAYTMLVSIFAKKGVFFQWEARNQEKLKKAKILHVFSSIWVWIWSKPGQSIEKIFCCSIATAQELFSVCCTEIYRGAAYFSRAEFVLTVHSRQLALDPVLYAYWGTLCWQHALCFDKRFPVSYSSFSNHKIIIPCLDLSIYCMIVSFLNLVWVAYTTQYCFRVYTLINFCGAVFLIFCEIKFEYKHGIRFDSGVCVCVLCEVGWAGDTWGGRVLLVQITGFCFFGTKTYWHIVISERSDNS